MRFKFHFSSKQYSFRLIAPLVVALAAAGTIACGSSDVAGAGGPASPSPTPGTIGPGIDHDGLARDTDSMRATARAEGREVRLVGTTTAGGTIEIADTTIQLPDDVYIKHGVDGGACLKGRPCPAAPGYQLARGSSTIWVGSDGVMVDEKVGEGEEGAFDFLREALR